MGLGEFFDSAVREFGRSEAGTLLRASDDSIDNLFRGPEARCRQRFLAQQRELNSSSGSSGSSGGGVGTLLLGAAFIGALALLGGSGDKNTNPNAK